jgi:hypothetical protein
MPPAKSAVLVLLAAIAVAAPVFAQSPGGGGGGGAGGPRGGPAGGRDGPRPDAMRSAPAEAPLSPGALVQVHLDQLEDDLKLAPAQRAAWTAYADRVQKLADSIARSRFEARAPAPGPAGAPAQLEQIAAAARSRMSAIDETVELGRALYAILTPEQKAIADPRLAAPVSLLVTGFVPAAMLDAGSGGARKRSP